MDIVVWHGESGSWFYVVAGEGEDWEVVASFRTRAEAERFRQ